MHDDQAGEHQRAGEQISRTEPLVEHDVTCQSGEDGLEAHHEGCMGRRGGSLADDLECESDSCRENASVEDWNRGGPNGGEGRLFK